MQHVSMESNAEDIANLLQFSKSVSSSGSFSLSPSSASDASTSGHDIADSLSNKMSGDSDEECDDGSCVGWRKSFRRCHRSKEENKAMHREVERRRTRRIAELIAGLKLEMERNGYVVDKENKAVILSASLAYLDELLAERHTAAKEIATSNVESGLASSVASDSHEDSSVKGSARDGKKAMHRAVERRRTHRINDLIERMKEELVHAGRGMAKTNKSVVLSSFLELMQEALSRSKVVSGEITRIKYFRSDLGVFDVDPIHLSKLPTTPAMESVPNNLASLAKGMRPAELLSALSLSMLMHVAS